MMSCAALVSFVALVSGQAPDVEAPIIEDIAAAASSPDTAPVVTVMMSDRGSGIGDAAVVYRLPGSAEWKRAPLQGSGTAGSSLFIAHLPDGLQRTGFEYYVEASDKAGNGPARIGSAEAPVPVAKATEATSKRLDRQREAEQDQSTAVTGIHPGWIMLALGTGVLAGAGAGAYLIDLSISSSRKAAAEADLRKSPTADQRQDLEAARDGYQNAIVYDAAIASVLGVVAVAALATGTALLVVANLE
jgi:hypothetical protein